MPRPDIDIFDKDPASWGYRLNEALLSVDFPMDPLDIWELLEKLDAAGLEIVEKSDAET